MNESELIVYYYFVNKSDRVRKKSDVDSLYRELVEVLPSISSFTSKIICKHIVENVGNKRRSNRYQSLRSLCFSYILK